MWESELVENVLNKVILLINVFDFTTLDAPLTKRQYFILNPMAIDYLIF